MLLGAVAGAAFFLGTGLWWANRAPIGYDEWEHVHAAYLVAHGQRLYVQVWENHPPLFYLLAGWLFPFSHPSFSTFIELRYVALAVRGLGALLGARWAKKYYGTTAAVLVLVFALTSEFLITQSGQLYLDSWAAPLLIGAAILLSGDDTGRWRPAAAGACLAAAGMFTQKAAVVAAIAVVLVFANRLLDRDRRRRAAGDGLLLVIAAAAVVGAALLPFLGRGGLKAMYDQVIGFNSGWKAGRIWGLPVVKNLAERGGLIYLVAGVGVGAELVRLARTRGRYQVDVMAMFLLATAAAIPFIPQVYGEYFVIVVPFMIIFAGVSLARGVVWAVEHGPGAVRRLSPGSLLAVVTCLLLLQPLAFDIKELHAEHNTTDRANLAAVMRLTGPHDPVYDTYSGLGVFRPNAYFYWILHKNIQAQLQPAQYNQDLIADLERVKPKVAIMDFWTQQLPSAVQAYLSTHYRATPDPVVWVRR